MSRSTRHHRGLVARRWLLGTLTALLALTLLPLAAPSASAAPATAASPASTSASLTPNGGLLLGAPAPTSPVAPSSVVLPSQLTLLAAPTAVAAYGAPAPGTGSTVVLAGFWSGLKTGLGIVACGVPVTWVVATKHCVGVVKDIAKFAIEKVWDKFMSPIIKEIVKATEEYLVDAADGITNWILTRELASHNTVTEPVLSCSQASNWVAKDCGKNDSWFLGQFGLMRQIGLFLITPLFMLVVIQSIIRGSMYFLLRAALIMLPAAILGSVVVVTFAQILLNISNDISDVIAGNLTDVDGYQADLHKTLETMNENSFGFFIWIWLLTLIVASAVIFVELVLREVGIYLVAFFLPLGFAAMIWPSTAKMAKRLVELEVGLIFAKPFILVAVSLGLASVAHTGVAQTAEKTPGESDKTTQTIGAVMNGVMLFGMGAFAGTRVLAITPAALAAAEGRIANPGGAFSAFQMVNMGLGRVSRGLQSRQGGVVPSGGFNNRPGGGAGGGGPRPGAGTPPPNPPAGGGGGGAGGGGDGGGGAGGGGGGGSTSTPPPPPPNGGAGPKHSQDDLKRGAEAAAKGVAAANHAMGNSGQTGFDVKSIDGQAVPSGHKYWNMQDGKATRITNGDGSKPIKNPSTNNAPSGPASTPPAPKPMKSPPPPPPKPPSSNGS